jgi:hypothetical protein
MFLAEGGVGVFIPYTFPANEFVSGGKKKSSLLTLYFCNAEKTSGTNHKEPWLLRVTDPERFRRLLSRYAMKRVRAWLDRAQAQPICHARGSNL